MYTLHEPLGAGGFSTVYRCSDRTGVHYACKILKKSITPRPIVEREIHMMRTLNSPRVIRLFDVGEDEDDYYLIQELCKGGTVCNTHSLPMTEVKHIVKHVLQALVHIHDNNIVHRDIKPKNVFIQDAEYKLGDFGAAVYLHNPESIENQNLGTMWYISPESLNMFYCKSSDIWSIGIMTYELLCGEMPFNDIKYPKNPRVFKIWQSIFTDTPDFHRNPIWTTIDESVKDFIRLCLEKDPNNRPDALSALSHPWLRNHTSIEIETGRQVLLNTNKMANIHEEATRENKSIIQT
jgi:serine/threonine protein kinase